MLKINDISKLSLVLVCTLAFFATNASAETKEAIYPSPFDLVASPDGSTLYIARDQAQQITIFSTSDKKITGYIDLKDIPTGLAISPDGKTLYVTAGIANGKIFYIDLASKKVTKTVKADHSPAAPTISPDGKTLYICSKFKNQVHVYKIAKRKRIAVIDVTRQPSASAITPDGKTLLVTNLLPAGPANSDFTAATVSVIDTASNKVKATLAMPNGSIALRGICLSPDAKFAYVTHVLARYQLPTTQLERGWMNTNALTVIDVENVKTLNTVLLDDVDLGAANPWGVTCTADGKYICVTIAGTHEICVIDRLAMHDKLNKVAAGEKVSDISRSYEDVPNDLSFLVGMKRRLKLKGNSPRGLIAIGDSIYAAEYFTNSIAVVNVTDQRRGHARSIELGQLPTMIDARKGEMYFSDAQMCFQKWQSCTSCHPDAGRPDALNWDLLNDGMGNPKNTKSLMLSHRTPPVMVTGIRDKAETAVRAGIKYIQFAVRPEEDAQAIDEYLKSLQPVPSPYLVKGKLSSSAKRGKKVFTTAGCISCHSSDLFTNLKKYDVGTGNGSEEGKLFDTPTLVEVWRTGPYLYDGRAVTIKKVITKFNVEDKHGKTSDLTEKQLDDLAEYVLSL